MQSGNRRLEVVIKLSGASEAPDFRSKFRVQKIKPIDVDDIATSGDYAIDL